MIMIDAIRTSIQQLSVQSEGLPTNRGRILPGRFDVICARGKQAYNHEGNRFFRQLISLATEKYSKVESKLQRSMIVSEIVDAIRAKGNGFIRKNNKGEWIECSDVMCREKVGQHFRNTLGCRYKSSTKSKQRTKEESVSRLSENLVKIVFSSKAVTEITERFALDLVFIDESSEDEFYEKAFAANVNLLQTFKEDTSLVQQIQHDFSLGEQQQQDSSMTNPRKRKDCGHALAA